MSNTQTSNLPSPPFYTVDGVNNLRVLGGYAITPTTSLRRNYLYRSAHLSEVTPSGAKTIAEDLKISKIYDFRSEGESAKAPSVEIPGTTRLHVPVFRDTDASPEGLTLRYRQYASTEGAAAFARAYGEMLNAGAKSAFKTIFEHIRDRPTEPLLFHCTAGKDRTGVFAALVMRIAGVPDDEVIGKEYELTELGMGALKEEIIQRLLEHPALEGNVEGVRRMVSAKSDAMKITLGWLDSTFGGIEGYMKEAMGFTDDDIQQIRSNLVVEEKSIL